MDRLIDRFYAATDVLFLTAFFGLIARVVFELVREATGAMVWLLAAVVGLALALRELRR